MPFAAWSTAPRMRGTSGSHCCGQWASPWSSRRSPSTGSAAASDRRSRAIARPRRSGCRNPRLVGGRAYWSAVDLDEYQRGALRTAASRDKKNELLHLSEAAATTAELGHPRLPADECLLWRVRLR